MSTAGAEDRETVLSVARRGRVAELTIDRPPHNILDLATIHALSEELEALVDLPPTELQVLILRGAGGKAFSTGVAIQDHIRERIATSLTAFHRLLRQVVEFPTITVAAIEGHCLGGGLELAAACDLRIATDESTLGQPEIDVGCFPPFAAALFPRLLGHGRTADLLTTGRRLSCQEAEALGLVDRRAATGALDRAVRELTQTLTGKSSAALRATKKAIRSSWGDGLWQAVEENERIYLEDLASSPDLDEGVAAFLEKRAPNWSHR